VRFDVIDKFFESRGRHRGTPYSSQARRMANQIH
jgi:hypothetical protein